MPSMPGMLMSVSTRSKRRVLLAAMPASPQSATCTSCPARRSTSEHSPRMPGSSSMTSILALISGSRIPGLVHGYHELHTSAIAPGGWCDLNAAAKLRYQVLDHSQPKTRAVARLLGGVEGIEDLAALFWSNARALVENQRNHALAIARGLDGDDAAIGHRLRGVLYEIDEDLLQALLGGGNLVRVSILLEGELDA